MKIAKKNLFKLIKIILISLILSVGVSYVFAWFGSSGNSTSNNIAIPINTSSTPQVKGTGTSTGSLLDVKGKVSSTSLIVSGDAVLGGVFSISNLKDVSTSTLCARTDGTIIRCTSSSQTTTLQIVSISSVPQITPYTAIVNGNTDSNGGATVTVAGIVWSTNPSPTTALLTKTTNGWAVGGPWASTLTSLSPNTTYHVRAYATNSVGTTYSSDFPVTTTAQ